MQLELRWDERTLDSVAAALRGARSFRELPAPLLAGILRQGRLLALDAGEVLIREGDRSSREMFVLVEGSLAVESAGTFLLRLDRAGDIIGELSVLQPTPRTADVIAETRTRVVAFPPRILDVEEGAASAPIFYVMLTHILAAKLRLTTAQSLLRKNERVAGGETPRVAVIDADAADRAAIRAAIEAEWPQAQVVEYADPLQFIGGEPQALALCVGDVSYPHPSQSPAAAARVLLEAMRQHGGAVCVVSHRCAAAASRGELVALGASDCVPKPLSAVDLRHTLRRCCEWFYKNRELDRIERQADTDALTGLANRRRLDEFLGALHTTFEEYRQPFSLIIADVDHFKHYNDRNGHPGGDAVLAGVGRILQARVRRGDLAARFGGEEFVVVLPNCPGPAAVEIAEGMRRAIEQEPFAFAEQQPLGRVTAMFGVATYSAGGDIEGLLRDADQCLYRGKAQGRNVVIAAPG